MAIIVTCAQCGKKLKVADSMGGKKGKCPACKAILIVPEADSAAPPEPASHADEGNMCPTCGKELASDDVFCTECGTNVETGERIEGV